MGFLKRVGSFFKKEIELGKRYHRDLHHKSKGNETKHFKDEFSVVYSYGHIAQIASEPILRDNYYDILDRIRTFESIISDGKQYDLTDVQSIYSISVPKYLSPEKGYNLGSYGTLEYLLMEKAFNCSTGNPELGVAYLRKAVELMKISDIEWSRQDFQRLVWRFNNFGAKSDASALERWYKSNVLTDEQEAELIFSGKMDKKLAYIHKEIITVKRVTTEDMLQFTAMPYQLNCPIQKHIEHGSHPFAYIDLNSFNQEVAKKELERLDEYIIQARSYIPLLTNEYHIDIKKVMLYNYSKGYGYTRLMCTPYTFTGKISKYPLSLFFMSRGDIHTYSVNGELFYNADGTFGRASVNIWKAPANYSRPGTGWMFEFGTFDSKFVLNRAETTLRPDEYGRATTVYRCTHIIKEENARELNRAIFEWLQKHFPDDCPKSISGFSRMRNANSKNYQALVRKAEAAGFVFPKTLEDVAKWPENQ